MRLNNLYELGDYKFGKILQQCLTEIGNNPGTGACLTIPNFTSTAAAEVACGKVSGNIFYNTTSDSLTYCDDNGNWIEIDWVGKCIQVDNNSTNIQINTTNITNLLQQYNNLQNAFNTHNHDGVNSPAIDIKDLVTTEPAGQYFFSTGAGAIDCGPIPTELPVKEGGTEVVPASDCLDFTANCFGVTASGNTAVIDIPALPQLKVDVNTNSNSITTNTTSISNIATQVANINTTLTTKCDELDDLEANFASHCHDGTDSPAIRIDKILSQDGTSANIANNFIACADGSGGWNYVDKATLAGSTITLTNVGPGEDLVAATSTSTNYDIKGIVGGCGISATSNATDVEVGIDFTNMANVGTALDITTDTIIVHDASTGECVQTTLQSLMGAIASKEYLAGKALTRTVDAGTGDCTFDLDLTTITDSSDINEAEDYLLFYDQSENDCRTVKFCELPTNQDCCLPDPTGLALLDSVYINNLGVVTKSDISDPNTVGQFIVTGFKPGLVCIQDYGVVELDTAHGLTVGSCYFEGPGGAPTSTEPTTGINNVLFTPISINKLSISAGTRPYEISTTMLSIQASEDNSLSSKRRVVERLLNNEDVLDAVIKQFTQYTEKPDAK